VPGSQVVNALSIDLEDWFHAELVRRRLAGEPERQVVRATEPILDLLDRHAVKATFFVLGDCARAHPELVRGIHARGHEIASHGMTHRPLWDLDAASFRDELREFRGLIGGLLGPDAPIYGFRAPTFSLDDRTRYAFGPLAAEGYVYDTSVFPVRNYMYGVAGAPCSIYRPDPDHVAGSRRDGPLLEFPMSVCELGPLRVPVSGGFYLRVTPYPLLRALLRRVNRQRPFVIYLHPWETHAGTPRVAGLSWAESFITYAGRDGALRKLERLLEDFRFAPMIDVLRGEGHVN
jgi:polysaccharide deacetylase family protein (PEP-CTERM system associated)